MFNSGFLLPESEIIATGDEIWEAMKVIAEELIVKFNENKISNFLYLKKKSSNIKLYNIFSNKNCTICHNKKNLNNNTNNNTNFNRKFLKQRLQKFYFFY